MNKTWRLIDSGPCSAYHNMALDEAIATYVRKGISLPTLRLYEWDRPSLSLGRFQGASGINVEYCNDNKIPIVRRPTGGRAILHDKELTYSFSARTDEQPFSKGLNDSYKTISAALALAFKKTGIHAEPKKHREKGRVLVRSPLCFLSSSFGEILINNKKAIGSSQKRWKDGLLQQGSIPYIYNEEILLNIFGTEKTSSLKLCSIGIKEVLPEFTESEFKRMISVSFEETFGIRLVLSHPSQEESLLARDLEDQKYTLHLWNLRH